MIADWIVQSRIPNSQDEIVKTSDQVRVLITQLESTLKDSIRSIEEFEKERRTILEAV